MRAMLAFIFIVVVSSCAPLNSANDGTGTTKNIPTAPSTKMQLKFSGGYQTISLSAISSISVQIGNYSRTLTGNDAQNALKSLNLNSPSERSPMSTLTTGTITLNYFNDQGNASRELQIQNNTYLEDSVYSEVLYKSAQTLDVNWLAGI